jgi:phage gp29-like protein
MAIKDYIPKIKNFFGVVPSMTGQIATRPTDKNDINNRIIRLKLERLRQDIGSWRQAISEAENVFYPNRLNMQRLYLDTVLNGHVKACMRERKDLTLLKAFAINNKSGTANKEFTELFKSKWFYDIIEYILDAQFYGYSYINWSSVVNDKLSGLQLIKRWNVSPDREQVLPFPNSFTGFSLYEEDLLNWSLYVSTNSENGISKCGYGLLCSVAPYEIYLRNLMGFNGDFVELFAAPFRHGRTDKTEGPERDEFEAAVRDMGSSGYAITDPLDEIDFKDPSGGGNGYKSYESFQERNEKTISKLFFGHSDAIDSRTGKLGSEQGKDSPVAKAIARTEASDARFVETVINDLLLDKLRELGFNIPLDHKFKLLNNKEEQEQKTADTAYNQSVATVVKTLSDSGVKVDTNWIEEQTGIPVEEKEEEVSEKEEDYQFKKLMNKFYP